MSIRTYWRRYDFKESVITMPSCYSCREVFEPSALRISYSKNYCESCGVGLFGADYFGFSKKPNPTAKKKVAVYLKVIFVWGTGFCLLVFLFFSMSAQSNDDTKPQVDRANLQSDIFDG
jgi:hypothetical protein